MDIVIEFFRDTLDGPFYIAWVVVCVILIFACIGYLAEKGINNKKEKEKYATVSNTDTSLPSQEGVVNEPLDTSQVESSPVTPTVSSAVVADPLSVEVPQTVSEVNTTPVQDVSSPPLNVASVDTSDVQNVVQPAEVVNTTSTVVTPTVVSPQVEPVTNVVGDTTSEVIPTINQDENNNIV